jgi:hypothetical protein
MELRMAFRILTDTISNSKTILAHKLEITSCLAFGQVILLKEKLRGSVT